MDPAKSQRSLARGHATHLRYLSWTSQEPPDIPYVSLRKDVRRAIVQAMRWILEEMVLGEDVTLVLGRGGGLGIQRAGDVDPALVVSSPWSGLLDRFRVPQKIVDAVFDFSETRDLDPQATLDEAFPLFERLLAAGLLRPAVPRGVPALPAALRRLAASRDFVDAELRAAEQEGAATGYPKASLTFGAAGVAYGLWHMARRRRNAALLERAEMQLRKAWDARPDDDAYYGSAPELAEESLGRVSPYHTLSGLLAVRALLGHARGDPSTRDAAVAAFAETAREPCEKLDLTLGQAGVLLASALLVDALGPEAPGVLFDLGREKALLLHRRLEPLAPIREDRTIAYLGIAHGWAGLLYALLAWARASGDPLPPAVGGRLAELAELGCRHGRGLRWRRVLGSDEPPRYLPSWCNGAAGLVHLWLAAQRLSGEDRYLALAEGCAWNAWEEGDASIGNLCCGLSGRAYGLVAFYKATGEAAWLERARRLAAAAMASGEAARGGPARSLYRGKLGTAALLADLEDPDSAAMPFFELASKRGESPHRLDWWKGQMVKTIR